MSVMRLWDQKWRSGGLNRVSDLGDSGESVIGEGAWTK